MDQEIVEVAIDAVRVSPFQPMRFFSEKDLKSLSYSITSVGLLHPPLVRKIESEGKVLYYELISGERRWRALQLLGRTSISVLVVASNDAVAAEATLVENLQRIDLTPIELAESFKNLIDTFSLTQEKVAKRIGKKRSTVANYLRLLCLPESVRNALSSSMITMGHAKIILSLTEVSLQETLLSLIVKKNFTVKETEKAARALIKDSRDEEKKMPSVPEKEIFGDFSEYFSIRLALPVSFKIQGTKGTMSVSFSNEEELKKIKEFFEVQCVS